MNCPDCVSAKANPHHGAYRRDCVDCGAREVVMARPMKRAQEGILQFYGRSMREAILLRVKELG